MDEPNQGDATEGTPPAAGPPPTPAPVPPPDPAPLPPPVPAPHPPPGELAAPFSAGPPPDVDPNAVLQALQGPSILRGLRIWFVLIGLIGLIGVLTGQVEMALSMALAGAFVAAHAADRDPFYRPLHMVLTGVLVAGGALLFGALAVWLATQSEAGEMRPVAVGIAAGGAVLCVLTALRPLADGLASAVFRSLNPTHVLRLASRLVMMVLLFVLPGWAAFPDLLDTLTDSPAPLLDTQQLTGSLVGLTMLALAGVGFLVRRDTRDTLERLGLRVPPPAHYAVVAAGIIGLYLLNLGAEALQSRWFPDLWAHDQRINELLAAGLGVSGALMLGVSAGVGEEVAIRGALQPRLGLIFTSLVFATLHVQYSWFGIATIFVLGVVLGWIRNRTSTTIAILVHTLYDILAAFTVGARSADLPR